MFFKKLAKFFKDFMVIVTAVLCVLPVTIKCFALPVGMHYYVGEKVLEKLRKSSPENFVLTEGCVESFLFGNVVADIGRLGPDRVTGKATDEGEFVYKILSLAQTDEEKCYAFGFISHMLADQRTENILRKIFGVSSEAYIYLKWYGILDNYVMRKKFGYIDTDVLKEFDLDKIFEFLPKNSESFLLGMKKWFLKLLMFAFGDVRNLLKRFCKKFQNSFLIVPKHEGLLKEVYKQVANYNVGDEELRKNLANLVGASMLLCIRERSFVFDEKIIETIDKEVEDLSDFIVKMLINKGIFDVIRVK